MFLAALGFVHSVAKEQLAALGEEDITELNEIERTLFERGNGRIRLFEFTGPLSFGAAADLAHQVGQMVDGKEVLILDFERMNNIDVSAAYAIQTTAKNAKKKDQAVIFANVSGTIAEQMRGLGLEDVSTINDFNLTRVDALEHALTLLETPTAAATA